METVIYKIKEGKLDQWKNWCLKLNSTLRNEAIQTLKEENLTMEGFFLFKINNEHYTVGLSYAEGESSLALDSDLNNMHKKMKNECLEKIERGRGEKLYFLEIEK
ncbi:MAG: DUF6176 family protein [bacterium]|nr:DUF6176 family protein [bacterium]